MALQFNIDGSLSLVRVKPKKPPTPRKNEQKDTTYAKVDYISAISIKPTYSVIYSVRADGRPPVRNGLKRPQTNKSMGLISKKAATKINNAMQWMLMFSPKKRVYSKATQKVFSFRVNFITLTLSGMQVHSDEFIKEHMLYPFIRWMGRSHGAYLYLWKAETQVNGNIHFHITTNTFIHWKSIRRKWNVIQSKHGYLKKWTEGNLRGDPNSTDVHSVRNEDQCANYMVKYLLKNDDTRRLITGRVWSCSPELSRMKIVTDQLDDEFVEIANCIVSNSEHKKLDHADLYLHPKLSHIKKSPALFDKILDLYLKVKPKLNEQSYFTVE